MTTPHLVIYNEFLIPLTFPHAVIRLVVIYAKGLSSPDSNEHLKIVQSIYH